MTLEEKLLSEKIVAKKPNGTPVEGMFVKDGDELFLSFDGHTLPFPVLVCENNYAAILATAKMKASLYYQGVTKWAKAKNEYHY